MKNNLKTAVLLAGIGGLLIAVGGAFGGQSGAAVGLAIGLVFVGGSYWFSDKLAIRSARAVEVSEQQMPRYHAIVRDLAQKADIPMPRLYVAPDAQPNAFATGRNPEHAAVCVNQGILDVLTRACWPTRSATSATATSSSAPWPPRWPWGSRSWPAW